MQSRVVTASAALVAVAVLAGCTSAVVGSAHVDAAVTPTPTASPTDPFPIDGIPGPSPTGTGLTLPPLGVTLEKALVDPDPKTSGPASGTITIDRLTKTKLLATSDINCLQSNGFVVGFAKDTSSTTPSMTAWAFELGSAESAANCADQMRRTDAAVASELGDLSAHYHVKNVTVYRAALDTSDGKQTVFRALYTSGKRLFRLSALQTNVSPSVIDPKFGALLQQQLALSPPS